MWRKEHSVERKKKKTQQMSHRLSAQSFQVVTNTCKCQKEEKKSRKHSERKAEKNKQKPLVFAFLGFPKY